MVNSKNFDVFKIIKNSFIFELRHALFDSLYHFLSKLISLLT